MTHHTGSDEGRAGVCRNCARPITFETRTEPGYLPREGWYDDRRVDPLVCFKAVSYRHVPLEGRERAIYDAGLKAARAAAPDALRERVEALVGKLEGFAATTIRADDAPLYAAIAAELRAALAERPTDGAGT